MRKSGEELRKLWREQSVIPIYPQDKAKEDRIIGAIMGVLIGDALGLGRLWYYEYDQLWEYGGGWAEDYCDPKSRDDGYVFDSVANYMYSRGVRAGFNSQVGELVQLLLEQVAVDAQTEWNPQEYIAKVNEFFRRELLPSLSESYAYSTENELFQKKMSDEHLGATNGLKSFSGRYSGEMIRHAFDRWYDQGSLQGKWWENRAKQELSSGADIALFGVILAALYRQPQQLFEKAWQLCSFWLDDLAFASRNLIYIMTVQGIINGVPLLDLCDYLVDLFTEMDEIGKRVASYDDVGAIAHTLRLVEKPQILDMDDRFMPLLMGMDCHIYHLLPGGYYYACKYCADFEQGMLYAANSGGNNVARTALTGGLLGAMNGLSGIPQRWVDGLQNYPEQIPAGYGSQGEYLLSLAAKIAAKSH